MTGNISYLKDTVFILLMVFYEAHIGDFFTHEKYENYIILFGNTDEQSTFKFADP